MKKNSVLENPVKTADAQDRAVLRAVRETLEAEEEVDIQEE